MAAFAVRRGQGLRALHDDQLPRVLRDARLAAASCSTTSRPRRGPEFVTRKVTQAVARIGLGLQEQLALGNLDAKRDWGFAGDYVKAMWLMLQQDEADDYVVATGETHSHPRAARRRVRARRHRRLAAARPPGPALLPPAEVDLLVGDPTKARATSSAGSPRSGSSELVRMMVDFDVAEQKQLRGL